MYKLVLLYLHAYIISICAIACRFSYQTRTTAQFGKLACRMFGPSIVVLILLCPVSKSFAPLTGKGPQDWTRYDEANRLFHDAVWQARPRPFSLHYRVKDSPPQEGKRRWKSSKSAEIVEHELSRALESLVAMSSSLDATNRLSSHPGSKTTTTTTNTKTSTLHLFPSIRECNSAIAKLGDDREFLRALRLFGKMRKAASLQTTPRISVQVPAPTLVTYSTLMSRFVKANKPLVALRLWKIMKSSDIQDPVVDVKACNILMNCYAKLADVKSAKRLLYDMETEQYQNHDNPHHPGDTYPLPNLITYNTFLTACQNAGDMDTAMEVFPRIASPDTLSYTALIATVGRRGSRTMGQHDPSPAFDLLDKMIESNVYANGKTFSALIDACGRCRRSDLALQGLRIMLRYKKERKISSLSDEVGAWTAAINACGRNERLDAAIQLFYTMPKFGIEPNIITCGSLVDSLLRAGRTAETLMILKFMKKNSLPVTEVMYTSLLQRAEKLAHLERGTHHRIRQAKWYQLDDDELDDTEAIGKENGKAIEIYTSLIESLSGEDNTSSSKSMLLMKVWLWVKQDAFSPQDSTSHRRSCCSKKWPALIS
jgi:pentatricopeptide repeat protein